MFYDSFLCEKQSDEFTWYDYEMINNPEIEEEPILEEYYNYMYSCYIMV